MLESIRKDYQDFLEEYGFTQEYVDSVLAMPTIDDGWTNHILEVRESPIQGKGVFAVVDIMGGWLIAAARVNGERLMAGRYTNHSPTPNAKFVLDSSGDLGMFAISDIKAGEEVTINYRQAGEVNGYKK